MHALGLGFARVAFIEIYSRQREDSLPSPTLPLSMADHLPSLVLTILVVAAMLFWSTFFGVVDGQWFSHRTGDFLERRWDEVKYDRGKLGKRLANTALGVSCLLIVMPADFLNLFFQCLLRLRGIDLGMVLKDLLEHPNHRQKPSGTLATRRERFFSQIGKITALCLIGGAGFGLCFWLFWIWMFPAVLWVNYVLLTVYCLPLPLLFREWFAFRRDRAEGRQTERLLEQIAQVSAGGEVAPFLAHAFSKVRSGAISRAAKIGDSAAVAALDARLLHYLGSADRPWQEPGSHESTEIEQLAQALQQIGGGAAIRVLQSHYRPAEWNSPIQRELWKVLNKLGEPPPRSAVEAALAGLATPEWQVALAHLRTLQAFDEATKHEAFRRQIGSAVGKLLDTAGYALNRQHHHESERKAYDQATDELNALDDLMFAHGLLNCIKSRTPASQPNAKGAYLKAGTRIYLIWDNNYAWDRFADLVNVIERRVERMQSAAAIELLRKEFRKDDFPLTESLLQKCNVTRV